MKEYSLSTCHATFIHSFTHSLTIQSWHNSPGGIRKGWELLHFFPVSWSKLSSGWRRWDRGRFFTLLIKSVISLQAFFIVNLRNVASRWINEVGRIKIYFRNSSKELMGSECVSLSSCSLLCQHWGLKNGDYTRGRVLVACEENLS